MPDEPVHFIRQIIEDDREAGKTRVATRFPPEPNGYLHIGHAKSICLNFGLANRYSGTCNLRFDDTNPLKEEQRYVDSIIEDIRWLGFRWPGADEADPHSGVLFASDYFAQMYEWAVELVKKGLAYVDDQTPDDIRKGRGTLTEPGTPSPNRDRTPEENLDILERMRRGDFADGSRVLRAKIDMNHPNLNMRDPVMYRVLNATHHRTGAAWCIYPMYDWAHGLEDSIEEITHSLCTLEFENHRPLYNWFIEAINRGRNDEGSGEWGRTIHHPRQIEFARLNFNYTIMSKRFLLQLVKEERVSGWDDPRMPTLAGIRRRGYTPEAIRALCDDVGVTKFDSVIDLGRLENAARDHLNKTTPRRMCVLDPIKVTITNWADGGDESRTEWIEAVNNPEDASAGTRPVPFTKSLYIERDDFMENPPKKFFRLSPGGEVRLRYAYWIKCEEVIKDASGTVIELRCTYDPKTRGGESPPPDAEGKVRKVKATLHWVSAEHAVTCAVHVFDRLFNAEQPGKATGNMLDDLNPDSLTVLGQAKLEPNWRQPTDPAWPDSIARYQFERHGYFCVDKDSHSDQAPTFNRTVSLKDTWAKVSGS